MNEFYLPGLFIKATNDKYNITISNNYFDYKIRNHHVFYVDQDIY